MVKKRKSDGTRLDEVDRSMYGAFCSAGNSLSQLYTQATHQQSLSFQAGERHALGKLYDWILKQQNHGVSAMTGGDILAYLREELDYGAAEKPPPASQTMDQMTNHTGRFQVSSNNASGPGISRLGLFSCNSDQTAGQGVPWNLMHLS